MATLLPYHPKLLAMLQGHPPSGSGHRWLMRVAVHLRHYHTAEAVFRFLRACADLWTDRRVPDEEIRRTVERAFACRVRVLPSRPLVSPDWPPPCSSAIARVLQASTPVFSGEPTPLTAVEILPRLFRHGELVCCGYERNQALTMTLANALDQAEEIQFIVPNPMTDRIGRNQDGAMSTRCLANTGPRRFLVIESDSLPRADWIRVLSHLHRFIPLALAVDTAGKSVHGWFNVESLGEVAARAFFAYAVHLGADPSTWTRCQFVRMPGGSRPTLDGQRRQAILYASADLF